MIAEDFGSVRVLATESIAGTTFEVACARTGPKDRRGRGQRSLCTLDAMDTLRNHAIPKEFRHANKRLVRYAGSPWA